MTIKSTCIIQACTKILVLFSIIFSNLSYGDTNSVRTLLTAVGEDYSGIQPPLLITSNDGGHDWKANEAIGNLKLNGTLNAASCAGNEAGLICTAAGFSFKDGKPPSLVPLLAVSTDGGINWSVNENIPNLPALGSLDATSCTGTGASTLCTAAGSNQLLHAPLILVSPNQGRSWATVSGLPSKGSFHAISCTGEGSNAVCAAVGNAQDTVLKSSPLLVVSTDGGKDWTVKNTTPALPSSGMFNAVSCTGSGVHALCSAVGQDNKTQIPLLAVSQDGGNSWILKRNIPYLPKGVFDATSCTGSGNNAICTATGMDLSASPPAPLLVVSHDGGNRWEFKNNVPDMPIAGKFNATNCTGEGSRAICIAAGFDQKDAPLLAVSTDAGNTWRIEKSIMDMPLMGSLFSASCTRDGKSTVCIAAGHDQTGSEPPLLLVSTDSTKTWVVKKTIADLPKFGYLFAASGK